MLYVRTKDYVANLKRYIKEDVIYQSYLNKTLKEKSDFDQFCIEHCEDIAMLIEENKKLKQELSKKIEN